MRAVRKAMMLVAGLVTLAACKDVVEPTLNDEVSSPPETEARIDTSDRNDAVSLTVASRPAIRLFVVRSGQLWEILEGSRGGGEFIRQSRPCAAVLAARQSCPAARRVVGFTDRASRSETVATLVSGSGRFTRLGVTVQGRVRGQWRNVPAPAFVAQMVSPNPTDDNIAVFVEQNGVITTQRVPVGTRPSR